MKKRFLINSSYFLWLCYFILGCDSIIITAQNSSPYAIFGHPASIADERPRQALFCVENSDSCSDVKEMVFDFKHQRVIFQGQLGYSLYDKTIEPELLLRFYSVDPLSINYPASNPYHFTDNNPIQRREVDGRWWIITTTFLKNGDVEITFEFSGAIQNRSSRMSEKDMVKLKELYERQFTRILTQNFEVEAGSEYAKRLGKTGDKGFTVHVKTKPILRVISHESELKKDDHLIEILNQDDIDQDFISKAPKRAGLMGFANRYGDHIRISEDAAQALLDEENCPTFVHEAIHTGGLGHSNDPHDASGFIPDEDEAKANVMFSNSSTSKSVINLHQILFVKEKYDQRLLNRTTPWTKAVKNYNDYDVSKPREGVAPIRTFPFK